MPSGSRSKEDTWKADDLGPALRGKKDDHRKSDERKKSDKDVRERRKTDKDEDRDRKGSKHRRDTDGDRVRDKDRDRDRDKDKDRDRDKDREKRRDKDKDRDRDRDKARDKDRDRDRGKDRDRDKDKDRDRDREKGRDRDKEKARDKDKDRDRHDREKGGKERERSERHRSKQDPENGDNQRRDEAKKSTDEKTGGKDRGNEERHHRRRHDDGEDHERHRRDDDEERKHRSHREKEDNGGKSRRHRDSDVDRKRSQEEQGDDRKHRSHRDKDKDRDRNERKQNDKDSASRVPDVKKEQKKEDKPHKAPQETKETDPDDPAQEPESVSDESEMWRRRIAEAAGSVERHSSQECVRASSSSMSGDILDDFSFTDDVGDQDNGLIKHMLAGSSRKDVAEASNGKSTAAAELEDTVAAQAVVPIKKVPSKRTQQLPKDIRPQISVTKDLGEAELENSGVAQSPVVALIKKVSSKRTQPIDAQEVKPELSVAKAAVKAESVKGKPVKPSSSKSGQPEKKSDRKGSVVGSGGSSAMNASPPKRRDSKKLLTKKVYSNADSPLPRSPARKDSITRDADTPVSGQRHLPQHRGSAPSPVQQKKIPSTKDATKAWTKDATKITPSPRRKSISDAGRREKENKLPPQSRKKDLPEIHEGEQVQKAESRTGSTEKCTTKTNVDVLPVHETCVSTIDRRTTIATAKAQSPAKPIEDTDRRTTVIPVVKAAASPPTAKLDVAPEYVLKEDGQTTKKKVIAGSKLESRSGREQESNASAHKNAVVSKKNPSNSGQVGQIGSDKENSPKTGTRQKDSPKDWNVHKGKVDSKKSSALHDAVNSPTDLPSASNETLKEDRSLEMDNLLEKHRKTPQRKDDATAKVTPQISTATRALRGGTPVPEQRPSTSSGRRPSTSTGRRDSREVRAREESPRTTTPDDELKEAIPDESEGRKSPDRVGKWLKKKKKKVAQPEDDNEYGYDDDEFEDYEDDFEDDEDEDNESSTVERDERSSIASSYDSQAKTKAPNNDLDELLSALDKENERLLHSAKNRRGPDLNGRTEYQVQNDTDHASHNRRTFINFTSAKQSQMSGAVATKARRRGNDLLKMIELDVSGYELFDMPPVNEYELYMRTFGCSNTRQAYVQTNEDDIECDTQTEETEVCDKWSQHPPEDFNCAGGDEEPKSLDELERKPIDAVKLGKFLHNASQVITMLLEENYSEISTRDGTVKNQSRIVLSESFVQLEASEITKDRHVAFSHFSPLQTKFLLTAYSKPHNIHHEDRMSNCGVICVWNVGEPSQPEKVLVCESVPRCCCFSPGQATLVFAGMHDGSLVVWDLTEPSSLHRSHSVGEHSWLLRYPTYNTAGVLHHENHHSSIVQVTPIVAAGDSAQASLQGVSGTGGGEGMSFQLATLEEQAIIHLWVVAEISHPDPAGSESDFGLLPGGKVKLVKSSSIQLEISARTLPYQSAMQALDMCLLPQNNSHFYVATDAGSIVHGVRYGGKAPPKAYHPQTEDLVRVNSIDFSPFGEPTFLAGCEDGSLRLFMTESEFPLITWPEATEGATPIAWVRWCRSRPSVFFVLDSNAFLYIWDLLIDDLAPLKRERVADERVTSFALSNDYAATGYGTPGRKAQMVMCLENGATEVHTISREFSAMMPDEVDLFSQYLQKVV